MPFSKEEVAAYKKAFNAVDASGDGQINSVELGKVLEQAGCKLSPDELKFIIDCCDKDKSGSISWDEFIKAMEEQPLKKKAEASLRRLFNEVDTDKSGTVSADELKVIISKVDSGKPLSDAELKDLIKMVDKDGDGKINFEEFVAVFME